MLLYISKPAWLSWVTAEAGRGAAGAAPCFRSSSAIQWMDAREEVGEQS